MVTIRDAGTEDAKDLLDIYSYYVEHTAISFELTTPSLSEFKSRMNDIQKHYPYLVIEQDGQIKGYAYAHLFVGRDAYSYSAETTIYLDHDSQ